MENQIAYLILLFVALWWFSRAFKRDRHLFTKKNAFKTASTLGFLALGLVGLIAFCATMLNSTKQVGGGTGSASKRPDYVIQDSTQS